VYQFLNQTATALSSDAFIQSQSDNERKAIYIFLQAFSILPVIIFTFSGVAVYFVGMLLNPNSSLFEWSSHHKVLVMIVCSALLTLPATVLYSLSVSLGMISMKWYKSQQLPVISPVNVWILTATLLLFPAVVLTAFIATF
ncbi:MAG: hypothetical protein AAGF98_07455, partial [Cyanobacteria bacterium P01_H01_bin.153]